MRGSFLVVAACVAGCIGQYVRKTSDERVEATPERLARGKYLVDGPGACGVCHTTWNHGEYLGGESADYLAGGNYLEAKSQGYGVWVPNITPSALGTWSDDQVMRAIRDGVHADGHLLLPFMPFPSFQHMSDEDVRAVVAYLRSVPPREQNRPRRPNQLPPGFAMPLKFGAAHHQPVTSVAAPPAGDQIRRGRYLAEVAHCPACHALGRQGEVRQSDPLYMAGSNDPLDRGIGKVWARNLTPDRQAGIGRYSSEEIRAALVSGERLDGARMASPMAELVPHYAKMTAEDLDAIVAWLQSLEPSARKVPPRELNEAGKRRFQ
jgi:mono/diheme cytochrome c family protein